jgi:hypothetical protein
MNITLPKITVLKIILLKITAFIYKNCNPNVVMNYEYIKLPSIVRAYS